MAKEHRKKDVRHHSLISREMQVKFTVRDCRMA